MRSKMLTLIQRGLSDLSSLPPLQRADLLEGAGQLMRRWARPESDAAFATAKAIREAEQLQLSFSNVLNGANRA